MYYYFKDSNEKILHLPHCYHLNQAKKKRISAFESITRAEEKGYRICKHCFGLKPYIKDEKENIEKSAKTQASLVDIAFPYWISTPYTVNGNCTIAECLADLEEYQAYGEYVGLVEKTFN